MPHQGLPQASPATASAPGVLVKEETRMHMATIIVTPRVPEFWIDQPSLWFFQAEAMLSPQKMSDEVGFNLVITKLLKGSIQQVPGIPMKPPDTKKRRVYQV